jgi:sec-independent protein translocase protein TatA
LVLGAQELLVILVIVRVLFGESKLPDLAKSLGRSMKEFKKGIGVEPEAEQASTPQPMAAPQACAHCKKPLETGWSHCPRLWDARGAGTASSEVGRRAPELGRRWSSLHATDALTQGSP